MSLMLKGLDMPKYLNKPLRLEIHADGHVWIDHGTDYEYIDDVAVQIPKGHGRVIDEKEVAKHQILHGEDEWSFDYYYVIMDDVEKVPTILEAEE